MTMHIIIWHTAAQFSNLCARGKEDFICNLKDFFPSLWMRYHPLLTELLRYIH